MEMILKFGDSTRVGAGEGRDMCFVDSVTRRFP